MHTILFFFFFGATKIFPGVQASVHYWWCFCGGDDAVDVRVADVCRHCQVIIPMDLWEPVVATDVLSTHSHNYAIFTACLLPKE